MRALHALVLVTAATSALAAPPVVSLRSENEPTEKPWESGAIIAYSRTGDTTTALADAELKLRWSVLGGIPRDQANAAKTEPEFDLDPNAGARKLKAGVGAYVHRNTTSSKPRNDRGISLSLDEVVFPPSDPAGAVYSWGWIAQTKFGKTLKQADVNGSQQRFDVDTDRQLLGLSGYYQPAMTGTLPTQRNVIWWLGGSGSLYSDHASGSNAPSLNGRVSGLQVKGAVSLAPFGLEPSVNKVGNSTLRVVPMFTLSAQVQHDLHANGGRNEDTRRLYTAELVFKFGKPGDKGGIPSLVISREVGADILTGRARQAETKLALGILF